MQNRAIESSNGKFVPASEHRNRVVVLYDDLRMGRHAVRLAERILGRVEEEEGFACSLWPERALDVPAVRLHLGREAAEADLVLIGARQPVVSGGVRSWISSLAEKATAGLALVFLFDRAHEQPGSRREIQAELEELAAGRNVGVFVNSVELPSLKKTALNSVPARVTLEAIEEALAEHQAEAFHDRSSNGPVRDFSE